MMEEKAAKKDKMESMMEEKEAKKDKMESMMEEKLANESCYIGKMDKKAILTPAQFGLRLFMSRESHKTARNVPWKS